MNLLVRFLINALIIYGAGEIFSGIFVSSYMEALVAVLLLSIVNTIIKPILTILTLPITILTLGLFLLVINGGMVLLVDWMLDGFEVAGWLWAILLSIILAVSNLFLSTSKSPKESR